MAKQAKESCEKSRIFKIISIIGFSSIVISLFIIGKIPPSTGYESSIYNAYPYYFWILIITAISSGIIILIQQIPESTESNWYLVGIFIVLFCNSIILSLPFFRGYAIYPNGDALSHLGMMKDISITGHVGTGNFYPIVHIIGRTLLDITCLSDGIVTNIIFVIWSIVYLLNVFLISNVITENKGQSMLIIAFACPLSFSYFHTLIHPSILSIFMIPLLLYLYHIRENNLVDNFGSSILLVIVAFMITFTHPLTSIYMAVLLLYLNISRFMYIKIINNKSYNLSNSQIRSDYNLLLIVIVSFFAWYLSYSKILKCVHNAYNFLILKDSRSIFDTQTNFINTSTHPIYEIIQTFIFKYGGICLYFLVSLICVIIILKLTVNRKTYVESMEFTYSMLFIASVICTLFSLYGYTGEQDPIRISRFFLIISPIINGLVIYQLSRKYYHQVPYIRNLKHSKNIIIGITTVIIIIVAILSIFNVYGSSRTVQNNLEVTKMQIEGFEWFGGYQNRSIATLAMNMNLRRFEDLINGFEYPSNKRAILDSTISNDFYLLTLTSMNKKSYEDSKVNLDKLEKNDSIIYNNGEFIVRKVYGKRA